MRSAVWLVLVGVLGVGCGDLLGIPSQEVYAGDGGGPVGSGTSMWSGFVPLGGLGGGCTAALALGSAAASAFKRPLTFMPCASGETHCEELSWDGALMWDPGGTGDLLVFDVQFVYGAEGQVTRLLVRHHYPIGADYGPNPYEAVLYDLSTGAPLAAIRNVSIDCFVVPVASPGGLWLAGAPSQNGAVVAAYVPVPGASASSPLVLQPISVDTTFLQNQALAFDDRLALSQTDGKIVVAEAAGGGGSPAAPGERVWLSALLGNRFLTVDPQATNGPQYFTLDRSLQFAPYGAGNELSTDGVHVAYYQVAANNVSLFSVSASDGTSDAALLAMVQAPTGGFETVVPVGSAMGDGVYVVLTYVGPQFGPVTATVVNLGTRQVGTGQVLSGGTIRGQAGDRQLVGYTHGYLWFAETGSVGGISKIVRVAAPGG